MSGFRSNWQRLAVMGLVLTLAGTSYMLGRKEMDNAWSARWAARDKADAVAQRQLEAANRAEEQRQREAMEQAAEHAEKQIEALRGDAAGARAAANRLQRTVAELQRRSASTIPAAGNASATGAATCGVLADVLTESVERNQHLAAEADRRRVAGLACERAYNAMIQSQR